MDPSQQQIIKSTFEAVADSYDHPVLRFFGAGAEHLADRLALRGDEEVLDVACGTGHVTLALARRLPHGRVTAADFSPRMLAQARGKLAAAGQANVELVERDMQALGWQARFDAAVCAFGIFFVDDMDAQLRRIAETVKPGGRIMISNFAADYMDPLRALMLARLRQFGRETPPLPWLRIAHEAGCRALFAQAGLHDIAVEQRDLGYFLADADEWWNVIWNAGFRRLVLNLAPAEQEPFKQQHLAEIGALRTAEGIRMPVPALFTSGRKPT
jgi:ubiquinone/menaquinone biosynthesis C-methylase UbiE